MLRQVSRETDQFPDEIKQPPDHGTVGIQSRLEDAAVVDALAVPPLHRARKAADLHFRQPERLADVP